MEKIKNGLNGSGCGLYILSVSHLSGANSILPKEVAKLGPRKFNVEEISLPKCGWKVPNFKRVSEIGFLACTLEQSGAVPHPPSPSPITVHMA